MLEFLAAWGGEIILSIIASAITGWFAYQNKKLKEQLNKGELYDKEQEHKEIDSLVDAKLQPLHQEHVQIENSIEDKLQPLYKELENLRAYERLTRVESDELRRVLLDSWCYRIKELCEAHLKQGYITVDQMRQLTEFYNFYTSLGGNGVAQALYLQVQKLDVK
jgi:hypothetical protein